MSTHNPLGVTFAAGVYTSIFGSAKQPINSHYAREMFATIKNNPWRASYQVIVGGSGGWQISQNNAYDELGVDCVVEGRSESTETLALFDQALRGEKLPRQVDVHHPQSRDEIIFPDKRTTFGVVEMTTGCGRRCQFCVPDLNPQIDLPRDKILAHVRANVRDGNKQISLATEDMFIWGQVHTKMPFYFPNREALLDLYRSVVDTPGVEQHVLSHATIAPAVVDPVLIEQLTDEHHRQEPDPSPGPQHAPEEEGAGAADRPRDRLGRDEPRRSCRARRCRSRSTSGRASSSAGWKMLNKHNWFPAMTLIIGSPNETDDDVKATLDVIYEVERRGLFAFFIPSIFTPLHDTRMEKKKGVTETNQLTPLQWQLMMKCWKMNLRPGQASWWAPTVWRLGAIVLWAWKLRKLNGPNFTWPMLLFASAMPEWLMAKMGKIYLGRPINVKTRKELLKTIKPAMRQFVRADTGDIPEDFSSPPPAAVEERRSIIELTPQFS